jgi:N-acetylglucosaminyldiphosphoundecaprenol N-acetyl-beta-D-mannosaminyltransferase
MMATASDKVVEILGVPVSVVDRPRVHAALAEWIAQRRAGGTVSRYVCACDVHSVMRANDDAPHMRALRGADMVLADGTPLVWVARLRGERDLARVPGPDLLAAVCERSEDEGWSHYFYGGAEGVAGKLAERLARHYPGLNIAGTWCPPFRAQTPDELEADIDRINASGADIVWIGLGCPKQEIWMLENHPRLQGRVLIGVGAAFDFHAGRIERAPKWMRDRGLEWLHRLASEPRRLWRRYLVLAPRFVVLSLAETIGVVGRRAFAGLALRLRG